MMPIPPMASGRLAAARLPKMTSSRTSSTGREMPSARPMSLVTSLLIAASVGIWPPAWTVRPGAEKSRWIASKLLILAPSLFPASSSSAYVTRPFALTNAGEPVDQYVCADWIRPRGSRASEAVTAAL